MVFRFHLLILLSFGIARILDASKYQTIYTRGALLPSCGLQSRKSELEKLKTRVQHSVIRHTSFPSARLTLKSELRIITR